MGGLFAGIVVLLAGLLMGRFWFLVAVGWLIGTAVQKRVTWQYRRKLAGEQDAPAGFVDSRAVRNAAPKPPVVSTEPDGPVPFGYKIAWLAVRCADPERVIAALRPPSRQPANWTTGLGAAYTGQGVFVSPALDGFVLVVGVADLLEEFEEAFPWSGLPQTFPEVQLFADHRVSDYYRWTKYVDGALARSCCYAGDRIVADVGPLTPEEQAVMLNTLDRDAFPAEEDVLDIAAAWGVDPRFEKRTYPPSTGWLLIW